LIEKTLFVSDLDHTLLRSDESLSDRTTTVVNRLIARGGLFTYATARSYTSALRVTSNLQLALPVVAYGGAAMFTPPSDVPAEVAHLPSETVLAIQDLTASHSDVEPIFYNIVEGRDRIHWRGAHATPYVDWYISTRLGDPRLLPVSGWRDADPATAFYCTMLGSGDALRELRESLGSWFGECFVTLGPDKYEQDQHWLEIVAADGTKARAIQRLKARVGADRVVVFGDNHNDVPMFGAADEGYAVSNAVPELLDVATDVLASNDEDAVAAWLETNVL
jgi:hypothetical protein